MAQELYFGEYVKFYPLDQKAADFMGADNLVGDRYRIVIRDEEGGYRAYLENRFGKEIGYLDNRILRQVQLAQAKGWETAAYFSFLAFTEAKDDDHPAHYWGEMAVMCYDPKIAPQVERFQQKLSAKMADGGRPQVDFGQRGVELMVANEDWFPTDRAATPKMGKGSSMVKDHQTPTERLVEQSRKRNLGCYVISWAFIIAVVALVVWGIYSCAL